MLELHGFQAFVTCDGQELETYAPVVDGRTISGWIASEVGKQFTITIRQSKPGRHPCTTQDVYIDGVLVSSKLPKNADVFTHDGTKPSPTTFAPFVFAPLRTTDDSSISPVENTNSEFGTFRIALERVIVTRTERGGSRRSYQLPNSIVHERDKKHVLGGLSVSTGAVVQTRRSNRIYSRPYKKSDPFPYVTFVFKYRSREFLLAQDIIPPERPVGRAAKRRRGSAGGAGGEEPKPAKRICVEELDADRERLRNLKDEMRDIEARLADDLGQPPPNVKREPFPFAVGEVVDLTGPESLVGPSVKREREAEISLGSTAGTVIDLTDD